MESYRYLIFGSSREQLADALVEYRCFAAEHPSDPLTETLVEVSRCVRRALKEAREIGRAIGDTGKVNAEHTFPVDRAVFRIARAARLRGKVYDQASVAMLEP